MVDALQTFVRDYELLIRSRKDIDPDHLDSIRTLVVEAQSRSGGNFLGRDGAPGRRRFREDALLTIDFMQVTDDCPDDVVLPGSGKRRTIDLKFKSRHVTGTTLFIIFFLFEAVPCRLRSQSGNRRRAEEFLRTSVSRREKRRRSEDIAAREANLGNEVEKVVLPRRFGAFSSAFRI